MLAAWKRSGSLSTAQDDTGKTIYSKDYQPCQLERLLFLDPAHTALELDYDPQSVFGGRTFAVQHDGEKSVVLVGCQHVAQHGEKLGGAALNKLGL